MRSPSALVLQSDYIVASTDNVAVKGLWSVKVDLTNLKITSMTLIVHCMHQHSYCTGLTLFNSHLGQLSLAIPSGLGTMRDVYFNQLTEN